MISKNEFSLMLEDYEPPKDILFCEEDERTLKVKDILFNKLDVTERNVIILYAELGSLRKLGTELGVSASSAYLKVKQIKEKIKEELGKYEKV